MALPSDEMRKARKFVLPQLMPTKVSVSAPRDTGPSIDGIYRSGDPLRSIRGQEQRKFSNFLRSAESTERMSRNVADTGCLRIRLVLKGRTQCRRINTCRRDGINPDVTRREFERSTLNEIVERRLGCGIGGLAGCREIAIDRGKYYYRAATFGHAWRTKLQQSRHAHDVDVIEIEERRWIGIENTARKARGGGVNQDVRDPERLFHVRHRFRERSGRTQIRDQVEVAGGSLIDIEPGDPCTRFLNACYDFLTNPVVRTTH